MDATHQEICGGVAETDLCILPEVRAVCVKKQSLEVRQKFPRFFEINSHNIYFGLNNHSFPVEGIRSSSDKSYGFICFHSHVHPQ